MKGLDYVAIDPGIAKDPKIIAIAAALGRDRRWLAGCFPEFFGHVAEHTPDGSLGAIADATLDIWAGDVEGFGVLVRQHLCDAAGQLTAWWRYNGKALAKLDADRQRKRTASGRESGADTPRNFHGNGAEDDTENPGKVHAGSSALTDTDTVTTTTDTHRARATVDRLRAAVLADAGAAVFSADFDASLRSAHDPEARAQIYLAMVEGLNSDRAIPLAVIGQALQEMRANGSPWTAKTLRVFCGDLVAGRAPRRPASLRAASDRKIRSLA